LVASQLIRRDVKETGCYIFESNIENLRKGQTITTEGLLRKLRLRLEISPESYFLHNDFQSVLRRGGT
jgi:hypothetical protein